MEELIRKYLAGEATENEQQEIKAWRASSEENEELFQKIQSEMEAESDEVDEPPVVIPLWNQKLFRIAITGVLGLLLLLTIVNLSRDAQPFGEVLKEKTTFELPDGSEVTVQRDGVLQLVDFTEGRAVSLQGKAYVEVEVGGDQPLKILMEAATIESEGATFLVKNPDNKSVEVFVNTGTVSFRQNPRAFPGHSTSIDIKAGGYGEMEVGKRGIRKHKITEENYLAWATGELEFQRTRMNEVKSVLEDAYDATISFRNPAIESCYLTVSFNDKTLEEAAKLISDALGITYEIEGNKVIFDGKGCR